MTAGLSVMALQQLCGVNVLAYYSSPVFKDSLPDSLVLKGSGYNKTVIDTEKNQVALGVGFTAYEDMC